MTFKSPFNGDGPFGRNGPFGSNTPFGHGSYRLFRDPENGWLAGVCAGLADYFGIDVRLIRLGWGLALIFFSLPALLAYGVLTLVLKRRPPALFSSENEQKWRRAAHLSPHETLRTTRTQFRDAEDRLARLEEAILSEEFKLRRDFKNM